MKKILVILAIVSTAIVSSCSKSDFEEAYTDPSKISTTTVEKQFAGFLSSNRWYVLPDYWNYFVVLRTTVNRYNQAVGWANTSNQYVPGNAGITDRWNNYYGFLAQFRELEKVYGKLSDADKQLYRIYMIAATIYFYDHSEKVLTLHGAIPWTEAGTLSSKGGDYKDSYAAYDNADAIYTKMLDDLKAFSTELNSITINNGILTGFKNQDFVNSGDLTLWKKYNNSLRLRLLMRVSDVPAFQARVTAETAEILGNAATYPLINSNSENIQIDVTNLNSEIHSKNFRTGLEDWNGNIAGKAMIDHMNTNADPRLRVLFEPGANAAGAYIGLDPLLTEATQTNLINGGTLAIYNRSTVSRNQFFPGVLFTAAEVSFLKAEAYLKAGQNAQAKAAYNEGIAHSVKFYYGVRQISNDNVSGVPAPATDAEIAAYTTKAQVNWDNAATNTDKLKLIATQKWIDFNVIMPIDLWAEIRRFDAPVLNFWVDGANPQTLPPFRWTYPGSELTYNPENYDAVRASDKLTTKIFWDVK